MPMSDITVDIIFNDFKCFQSSDVFTDVSLGTSRFKAYCSIYKRKRRKRFVLTVADEVQISPFIKKECIIWTYSCESSTLDADSNAKLSK